jgi:PAS domain S-box-containing protein
MFNLTPPQLTGININFRAVADNSPALIWTAGTDGLCNWFNRGWLEFTGRTMAQELGNCWTEGVHPQDFQPCVDQYLKHFKAHEEFLIEYRLRRSDGQYRWILDSGTPVFDNEGKFLGYNGVCFDIHERKESDNQKLNLAKTIQQKSEDRLSLVTHAAGIGIWDWNLQTMEMVWDDSMFELYHIKREDFSNAVDAWEKSLHPEDRQRAEHEVQEALNNIKPFDTQFRIIWPNGEVRYIKATAKVFFDDKGVPLSMLGTNRDVTEITLVDRMKSEFITTAAHELRTPMTTIFGYAELLKDMPLDAETQKEMISTIYDQSKAMIGLLNEVLDVAKMEARMVNLYDMKLQPIVAILTAVAATLVKPGNVNKVVLEISPNLPDVNVDIIRIEQAVRNLLDNAFKFSPNNGVVTMQVTEVMQNQQRKVLIAIEDHGIGMTPEQLKHIYERFYRADQSGIVPGTGLGMAIVQEIITRHGAP